MHGTRLRCAHSVVPASQGSAGVAAPSVCRGPVCSHVSAPSPLSISAQRILVSLAARARLSEPAPTTLSRRTLPRRSPRHLASRERRRPQSCATRVVEPERSPAALRRGQAAAPASYPVLSSSASAQHPVCAFTAAPTPAAICPPAHAEHRDRALHSGGRVGPGRSAPRPSPRLWHW